MATPMIRRLAMTAGNMLASLKKRKTVTRRCFRGEQPPEGWTPEVDYYCPTKIDRHGEEYPGDEIFGASDADWGRKSPYGAPGDPLVLTESWRPIGSLLHGDDSVAIQYKADRDIVTRHMPDDGAREKIKRAMKHGNWMPPMFQQAWASRAPAVVKSIRVEHVQEISEEDAKAEGVEFASGWEEQSGEGYCDGEGFMDYATGDFICDTARDSFRTLWDSINKSRGHGWDVNDFCWCIEYELDA